LKTHLNLSSGFGVISCINETIWQWLTFLDHPAVLFSVKCLLLVQGGPKKVSHYQIIKKCVKSY